MATSAMAADRAFIQNRCELQVSQGSRDVCSSTNLKDQGQDTYASLPSTKRFRLKAMQKMGKVGIA